MVVNFRVTAGHRGSVTSSSITDLWEWETCDVLHVRKTALHCSQEVTFRSNTDGKSGGGDSYVHSDMMATNGHHVFQVAHASAPAPAHCAAHSTASLGSAHVTSEVKGSLLFPPPPPLTSPWIIIAAPRRPVYCDDRDGDRDRLTR